MILSQLFDPMAMGDLFYLAALWIGGLAWIDRRLRRVETDLAYLRGKEGIRKVVNE